MIGPDGRFRFKSLLPGSYTISALATGQGEVRQTLDLTPGRADRNRGALDEYDRARQRLARRDVAGATRHLERTVELAPAYAEAWNHLGTISYQIQRYEDAEKYFRRALEADSAAYSPLVNLGGVLINLGRPSEALEYNRRAVRESPEDALAHSQLGMSYLLTGDDERALKHLRLSKSLDPAHFSKPQLVLAEIYARRGQHNEAAAELEDFIDQHPDAPESAGIRDRIAQLRQR